MIIVKEIVLLEVRDMLREKLQKIRNAKHDIRRMVDEKVPPTAGEEFIAVHGLEINANSDPASITKNIGYGFAVSITRRMQIVANEQAGEHILSVDDEVVDPIKQSMFSRCDEIVNVLNLQDGWTLLNRINAKTCDGTGGNFLIPFNMLSVDAEPRKVQAEHFDTSAANNSLRYYGLVQTIQFGGAEYLKPSPPPAVTP